MKFALQVYSKFDRFAEAIMRRAAQQIGRRDFLSTLGIAIVGTALPILPFDRSGGRALADTVRDDGDENCEYWRFCAIDGYLCTCCGGTLASCPPGTDPSSVSWVGTCLNQKDNKSYLISYNDCCGRSPCGNCLCTNNVNERPGYRMGVHNDINWCMANTNTMYHCTVVAIVGSSD